MPTLALLGTGSLFLFEASAGLFSVRIYSWLEPKARARAPYRLPIIGYSLIAWGCFCLFAALPPLVLSQWMLLLLSIPFLIKGALMAFLPTFLKDTPYEIQTNPRRWKAKSLTRMAIGVALIGWGFASFGT